MEKTVNKTTDGSLQRTKTPGVPTTEKKADIKAVEARPAPAPAVAKPAAPTPPPAPAPAAARAILSDKQQIRLELYQKNAHSVFVAGSFNGWNPQATPLKGTGSGKWEAMLTLPPGKHEYRFIVDGQWIEDPLAKESVSNPFGGVNSVLNVR